MHYKLAFIFIIHILIKPAIAGNIVPAPLNKELNQYINSLTIEHKFVPNELVTIFNQVQYQPKIIDAITKPYEQKPWDNYKQIFLTQERLVQGIKYWENNKKTLKQAENIYGVPAQIIVAILGVETLYGQKQGNYRVLDALYTLAFYYPKRGSFFKNELKEYLILCRDQKVNPLKYMGSYAGAIGMPQFMPSSYRNYAINPNNPYLVDLNNDNEAAIFSVANFLHKHGWKNNSGIAQPAQLKNESNLTIDFNAKQPLYELKTLKAKGITPITAAHTSNSKIGVIKLSSKDSSEFWITYPNFYVITKYNNSPQYALVVHILAQQLKNKWLYAHSKKNFAYV